MKRRCSLYRNYYRRSSPPFFVCHAQELALAWYQTIVHGTKETLTWPVESLVPEVKSLAAHWKVPKTVKKSGTICILSDLHGCLAEARAWKCDSFNFFENWTTFFFWSSYPFAIASSIAVANALASLGVYSASKSQGVCSCELLHKQLAPLWRCSRTPHMSFWAFSHQTCSCVVNSKKGPSRLQCPNQYEVSHRKLMRGFSIVPIIHFCRINLISFLMRL